MSFPKVLFSLTLSSWKANDEWHLIERWQCNLSKIKLCGKASTRFITSLQNRPRYPSQLAYSSPLYRSCQGILFVSSPTHSLRGDVSEELVRAHWPVVPLAWQSAPVRVIAFPFNFFPRTESKEGNCGFHAPCRRTINSRVLGALSTSQVRLSSLVGSRTVYTKMTKREWHLSLAFSEISLIQFLRKVLNKFIKRIVSFFIN